MKFSLITFLCFAFSIILLCSCEKDSPNKGNSDPVFTDSIPNIDTVVGLYIGKRIGQTYDAQSSNYNHFNEIDTYIISFVNDTILYMRHDNYYLTDSYTFATSWSYGSYSYGHEMGEFIFTDSGIYFYFDYYNKVKIGYTDYSFSGLKQ